MKKRSIKLSNFTLVELVVAMGVFAIILFVLISFFSSAQKVMTGSISRNETFENATIAMDLITRDLQCALYSAEDSLKGIYPFWHEADDKVNFIATTKLHDTVNDTLDICEVKYAWTRYSTTVGDKQGSLYPYDFVAGAATNKMKACWLVRSVTGNSNVDLTTVPPYPANNHTNRALTPFNKYNFTLYPRCLIPTDPDYNEITDNDWKERIYRIWKEIAGGTTAGNTSSLDFQYVIPCVVELKFTCYNKAGDDMRDPDGDGNPIDAIYIYDITNTAIMTPFPYCVKVDLTLLDKSSFEKWVALNGDTTNLDQPPAAPSETSNALKFRLDNQRTFSKMIYLGERKNY